MTNTKALEMETNARAEALGIYVVMSRDLLDAIEMIDACANVRALEVLRAMLMAEGTERTDRELNKLMLLPVTRRLMALGVNA